MTMVLVEMWSHGQIIGTGDQSLNGAHVILEKKKAFNHNTTHSSTGQYKKLFEKCGKQFFYMLP
jgi:hypothetical protein